MEFFNWIFEKIRNWRIVYHASKYSVCDVDIRCSSCIYCSKKGKYCTNKDVYKTLEDKNQFILYCLTGYRGKKIKLNFAINYCKLNNWCFSPDIKQINGKYYCFIYNRYEYSGIGWRECRFWLNDMPVTNIINFKDMLNND